MYSCCFAEKQFVDGETAVQSFVFSPPLTRTRKTRQSTSDLPDADDIVDVRQSLPARAPMPNLLPSLLPDKALKKSAPFFIKETRAKR